VTRSTRRPVVTTATKQSEISYESPQARVTQHEHDSIRAFSRSPQDRPSRRVFVRE
jgi:hypothetical protein